MGSNPSVPAKCIYQDGVVRSVLMSSRVTSTGYGESQESDYVGGTVV